jgi:hypothetical protein
VYTLSNSIIPENTPGINISYASIAQEIKHRLHLSQYLNNHGYEIKNDKMLCPFHAEKEPSFTLYENDNHCKDHYHCYGCCEHGDIIDFHAKTNNITKSEAIRQLAEHAGVEIAVKHQKTNPKRELSEEQYLHLKSRGMTDEIIQKHFQGGDYVTILFPEHNYIIDYLRPGSPKYKNPPKTAKPLIRSSQITESIYLVEGSFDFWSIEISGLPAACSLGTNLTKTQIDVLKQYKIVYICFDGDAAGRKAAKDLQKKLMGSRIINLPDGKDPNDMLIEFGPEGLRKFVEDFLDNNIENDEGKEGSDVLLDIMKSSKIFQNKQGQALIEMRIEGHKEVWLIESKKFRNLLRAIHYRAYRKQISPQWLENYCNLLVGEAHLRGEVNPLSTRIAEHKSIFYYDLNNLQHEVVQISAENWSIIEPPEPLFRRYGKMEPQVIPDRNGDPHEILKFVNIRELSQQILLLTAVISSLIPGIPHPALFLFGGQGTAKTTTAKFIRTIIDPSEGLSFCGYRNLGACPQYFAHNHTVILDNLSKITPELSDMICSAISGDGDSKRVLYEDDEDFIYTYQPFFIITSINLVALRPDLLRRSILFELDPIADENRKEECMLWTEFENARSRIFGGILNTLTEAMKVYPSIKLKELFPMADFTRWGAAISVALGYSEDTFIDAYRMNIQQQHEEAIENNPLSNAIRNLAHEKRFWEGRAQELLEELDLIAVKIRVDKRCSSWPRAANTLVRKLNELRPNLEAQGIRIAQRRGMHRIITIELLK